MVRKPGRDLTSLLASVPPTQAPRSKAVHDHMTRLRKAMQRIEENPSEAVALTQEIRSLCDRFLDAPTGTKPEDAEIIDTQALRDEVEAMIKDGPRVKYPGGSAEEAISFFQTHYGDRYNRDGLQVIFSPDLYVIDHVLMRALRAAYGSAAHLPLGDRKERTDAIAAGRFGDELARLKTRQALYKRVYNAQYKK